MKAHKYWSIGAIVTMVGTFYTGYKGLKAAHKYLSLIHIYIFRHTFASRFCENETNVKVIQEVMGHADVSTTMNIYEMCIRDRDITAFVLPSI